MLVLQDRLSVQQPASRPSDTATNVVSIIFFMINILVLYMQIKYTQGCLLNQIVAVSKSNDPSEAFDADANDKQTVLSEDEKNPVCF